MRTKLIGLVTLVALAASACMSETPAITTTSEPQTVVSTLPSTTTTSASTTTTSTSTTTTTLPELVVYGTINGLEPILDSSSGVVAIKIDNHPAARPHTNLQFADIVYELPVEAGLTRFIALFDRYEADKVGPVRSLRPTDMAIVNPPDIPLQVSGGSEWVLKAVRDSGTKLLTDNGHGTYRDNARKAPHNLYADTAQLRERIDQLGWGVAEPGNLWTYGEPPAPTGVAEWVRIPFSSQPASIWTYDETLQRYVHWYAANPPVPHTTYDSEGAESQVMADVLVVIRADQYTAKPPKPSDGKAVPAMDLMGSGDAYIFWGGTNIAAVRWERTSLGQGLRLVTEDGEPAPIPPGVIWVSIQPDSRELSYGVAADSPTSTTSP